ncbi:molybdate transport system ATP-binding protein [Fistulifera solaris]|uniref:Molybdate transport system ATP-binding protein n=1 Tax=Fistulifera solaris TaxID=1519565 RepID=A0A1Z5KLV0_FISSO|nr:molybdate transport system ATP-binding protein [Fistulifera solaris]|eukprot:GAX27259.1 molybdate transport system ATP-binding protein [Fistulifera solaris]
MIRTRRAAQLLHSHHRGLSACSFSSAVTPESINQDDTASSLLRMQGVHVGNGLPPLHDFTIQSPAHGGHIVLGRNGTGKSRLLQAVLRQDTSTTSIEHVSFESHLALLQKGGTVYKALAQGNLNKAAQFLIVRFGLFPLLHQDVRTLSNGQIKKVLIVRALSHRPALLLLDNAFDGLDVASRDVLKQLVSKTLQGFTRDILVQGVSARNTARTQVVQVTQRAEEIVDEFRIMTFLDRTAEINGKWRTTARDTMSSTELLHLALHSPSAEPPLPDRNTLEGWWQSLHPVDTNHPIDDDSALLVRLNQLTIERNGKALLKNLTWQIHKGERYIVGGLNGAGKSTLSRLLAHREEETTIVHGTIQAVEADQVGWVSTERHMALANSNVCVKDMFPVCQLPAVWLGVDHLMERSFAEISQGEQRLVLIASAIAMRPQLLVFDEPCQGLDLLHRQRVLDLVERICEATDMSLIYITHHMEERIEAVQHALHLVEGEIVFSGGVASYDPDKL